MRDSKEMFDWLHRFVKKYPFIVAGFNEGLFLTCFSRYFRRYKKIHGEVDHDILDYLYYSFEEDFPYGSFDEVETYWN